MHDTAVPSKTAAGRDEIDNRTRKVPGNLRSILLLVDGQRTAGQLQEVVDGVHAPTDALEQLVSLGLIADEPQQEAAVATVSSEAASRYSALYALMSDAVREHLGLRGYFMQLKIERCGTAEELLALVPELSTAIARTRDMAFATEFEQRLREAAQA